MIMSTACPLYYWGRYLRSAGYHRAESQIMYTSFQCLNRTLHSGSSNKYGGTDSKREGPNAGGLASVIETS